MLFSIKHCLLESYVGWRASIDTHTSLYFYKEIKSTFQMSPYITLLQNIKYRNILAKLRLSSHNLQIESGRHLKIPRPDRKCILCNLNDIEDEFHFVLVCPFYSDLRAQFIPKYYTKNPNMIKFIALLNIEKKSVLTKLAVFCIKAFERRDTSV